MDWTEGTIPVREGEGFDRERVLSYLRARLPGLPGGELEVRQFPAGASNLTYAVRVGGWDAVLRRPPVGPVPPRAHDMVREAALLARLHPVYPLAPRPYLVCDDPAVIGAPFSVMERRRGVVVDAAFPPGVEATPELGRRISEAVVDTLVRLHAIDWRAAGLGDVGRPDGFLERQVEGWIERWHRAQTEEVPALEPLARYLEEAMPPGPEPTVIHNDFKLNNLVLDPADPARVVAVLDWEMATVGDPLFDLAVSLSYWTEPADPPEFRAMLPGVTTLPGFYGRDEFVRRYAERSGRDVAAMPWYTTLAYFKLAVILQQIYARWVRGQTRDPRFAHLGALARRLVEHAAGRVAAAG